MNTWQPIDTAPKDRPILLWETEANCATAGIWCNGYTKPWHAVAHGELVAWHEDGSDAPIFDASHWMELPDPPRLA